MNATNHSTKDLKYNSDMKINFMIMNSILAACILLVNLTVLILIVSTHRLRRNLTNKILLCLVISDFLAGILIILHLIGISNSNLAKRASSSAVFYRIFIDIITLWQQLVTTSNLCMIISERFIATIYTYTIHKHLTKRNVFVILSITWITSFLYSCLQLIWVYPMLDGNESLEDNKMIKNADVIYSTVSLVLFVLLPIIILFILFLKMFQETRYILSKDLPRRKKEERRVVIIFVAMYVMFIILSLPYFLVRLALDADVITSYISYNIIQSVYLLKYALSLINPFIYTLNKPDFKRELRICKLRLKRSEK